MEQAGSVRGAVRPDLPTVLVGCQHEADDQHVDDVSIKAGIALAEWFGGEAKRVYDLFCELSVDKGQRELVELIRRRGGKITARELQASIRQYREQRQSPSRPG